MKEGTKSYLERPGLAFFTIGSPSCKKAQIRQFVKYCDPFLALWYFRLYTNYLFPCRSYCQENADQNNFLVDKLLKALLQTGPTCSKGEIFNNSCRSPLCSGQLQKRFNAKQQILQFQSDVKIFPWIHSHYIFTKFHMVVMCFAL